MSEENKYILQVKDLHTSFATDAAFLQLVPCSGCAVIWQA